MLEEKYKLFRIGIAPFDIKKLGICFFYCDGYASINKLASCQRLWKLWGRGNFISKSTYPGITSFFLINDFLLPELRCSLA